MKNKYGNIIWGILFIFFGIGLAGRFLFGWDFTIFFNGWWTLFIIIPSVISIIDNGFHSSNLLTLAIGLLLFLSCQDGIGYFFSWRLVLPVLLMIIGIMIILSAFSNNNHYETFNNCGTGPDNNEGANTNFNQNYNSGAFNGRYSVNFGERNYSYNGEFTGCDVSCSFGSLTLDLRNASINENCTIICNNSFGKVRILFPANVNVQILISPTLGNLSNKVQNKVCEPACPVVSVQGSCSFGEVEVL